MKLTKTKLEQQLTQKYLLFKIPIKIAEIIGHSWESYILFTSNDQYIYFHDRKWRNGKTIFNNLSFAKSYFADFINYCTYSYWNIIRCQFFHSYSIAIYILILAFPSSGSSMIMRASDTYYLYIYYFHFVGFHAGKYLK